MVQKTALYQISRDYAGLRACPLVLRRRPNVPVAGSAGVLRGPLFLGLGRSPLGRRGPPRAREGPSETARAAPGPPWFAGLCRSPICVSVGPARSRRFAAGTRSECDGSPRRTPGRTPRRVRLGLVRLVVRAESEVDSEEDSDP